jgi:hypothetical protein
MKSGVDGKMGKGCWALISLSSLSSLDILIAQSIGRHTEISKKRWFLKEVFGSRDPDRNFEMKLVWAGGGRSCTSNGALLKPKR